MRVVCDNCGASYKISDTKLTRDINKATCRKCGHQIVIRRNERDSLSPDMVTATSEFEHTELAPSGMHAFGPGAGYTDEVQSTIMNRHNVDHRESTVPRDVPRHAVAVMAEPAGPPPLIRPPAPPPYQNHGAPSSYAAMPAPQNTGVVPPHMQPPMPAPPQAPMQPGYAGQQPWRPHDPAGDMSLVMMASFGAAIGAAVLASSTTEMQTMVGLGIALWSSITSLMVLVTGDRGRKEAKVFLSMALSLVLAVGATAAFRTTGLAAREPAAPQPAVTKAPEPTPEPVAAAQPVVETPPPVVETPPPVVETPPPVVETPPPVVEAPANPPPPATTTSAPRNSSGSSSASSAPRSSSGSASSGSSSASSAPRSSSGSSSSGSSSPSTARTSSGSTPSTASTSAPATPEATGVPVTVLETMLSTNKSVKTCFGLYRQETGELPKGRINVKLTIQPSGTVSYAAIDGGTYAGTSLDSCLGAAIRKIQFPPFSGEAANYKYPFIL